MNNKEKSLEISKKLGNLIEEKFGYGFVGFYNDLYKVKDNNVVRRLKGKLGIKDIKDNVYNICILENKNKEFNDLVLKINDFVKSLNFEGFEISLKKIRVECDENDRKMYEENRKVIISLKELREMYVDNERELILSIRFKDI
jgi:uncharacterized protein CbrC (UPF0167 family)